MRESYTSATGRHRLSVMRPVWEAWSVKCENKMAAKYAAADELRRKRLLVTCVKQWKQVSRLCVILVHVCLYSLVLYGAMCMRLLAFSICAHCCMHAY